MVMKVSDLKKLLEDPRIDTDAEIQIEGCDCYGWARHIEIRMGGTLLITRTPLVRDEDPSTPPQVYDSRPEPPTFSFPPDPGFPL